MRVPPQQPPLAPDYLNLLQTRPPRAPRSAGPTGATAPARSIERVAPPAASRLPRGSLIDIKA
jgi:hypothetical protein